MGISHCQVGFLEASRPCDQILAIAFGWTKQPARTGALATPLWQRGEGQSGISALQLFAGLAWDLLTRQMIAFWNVHHSCSTSYGYSIWKMFQICSHMIYGYCTFFYIMLSLTRIRNGRNMGHFVRKSWWKSSPFIEVAIPMATNSIMMVKWPSCNKLDVTWCNLSVVQMGVPEIGGWSQNVSFTENMMINLDQPSDFDAGVPQTFTQPTR